ncbi:glycosyltransferase [Lacinutrix venerupis]|uniref:Glycosyl transferase family 1 n=1 Tax=Lacinutrix venerupis TaxID=1486034 RepID=A0AAC9LM02_9FLAO|nr:glycosyltransferase [Lacinutrix venerupis]APY00930.1 glycosyl transferase family 1 [Lacinutrix venerupis]
MKILLVGEYSRLHSSLKEGLVELGHNVTIVSSGDGMKKFKTDINYNSKIKSSLLLNKLNNLSIRFFKTDFIKIENAYRFKKLLPQFKGFDVVQLINEDALFIEPKTQIKFLKQLISQNKKLFVLCCGDDYTVVKYYLKEELKYSILTPYLNDKSLKHRFVFSLKYTTEPFKKLHDFLKTNSLGTIASDIDYHIPMQNEINYLGLIANPINIKKIPYNPLNINGKINIFLGINTHSSIKKGISFFEKALQIIQDKYPEKVSIKITENLPYNEYIKIYNETHILLDQVYGYDQGYNALEAMAKGKVVFTGAEQEWLDYYNLKENTVAINALPNVDYLVEKLEWLILNPDKILEISKGARRFIEREHNYISCAKLYLEKWNK